MLTYLKLASYYKKEQSNILNYDWKNNNMNYTNKLFLQLVKG